LQGGRPPPHQLPSAALDPLHAGRGLRRARAHEGGLRACEGGRLPLLFLRRCLPAPPAARGRPMSDGPAFPFGFAVLARDAAARGGGSETAHGATAPPAFMPVGTAATVKAMLPQSVAATGAQIVLGNTYHLMLRPGAERVAALGGLHRFMNWPHPILTDSGGYQVMSLSGLREIDEEGVEFRSHLDGSRHVLTPERSVEIQHLLDANITMAFDECTPYPATLEEAGRSLEP